jgi:hypothetical protein
VVTVDEEAQRIDKGVLGKRETYCEPARLDVGRLA